MQQPIGATLGSYQIVEQIGRGGMATVYKAYQPSMDRYVAIKVLPSHFTEDASFVGRFTQEARTLARLEHPHILPVHDYGEQHGITYLVMRYVEAGTLKDLITESGAMDLRTLARIMAQVGGAVDYAHSHGVVHRDIKPSNVLVDRQGNTFLTDFGIARLVAETAQFTASGAIIGTPAYMSPEQGLGQPADHRSDIYALGVMLYEMVTGRVPFEAETPLAVLLKHVNEALPLPRQVKPDLSPAVERVILKAMAKAPEDRYQSAQALVDDLQRAVTSATTETVLRKPRSRAPVAPAPAGDVRPPRPEPAAPPRAPARSRRRWPLFAALGVLGVLLIAVAVFVVPNLLRGEPEPIAVGSAPAIPTVVVTPGPLPTAQQGSVVGATPAGPSQAELRGSWTHYGNANFVTALARHENTLWVGSESGLVRWDLASGSYTRFGQADGLVSAYVTDLLVDDQGTLWVATDSGVNRFDGTSWITFDQADGLDADWIEALYLDDAGGLWAGSHGGERGLNYYDGRSWGALPIPPLPLEYPYVGVLGGNEEQGYYAALEDEGLALFDGEEWLVLSGPDGLPEGQILDVMLTSEDLWVSLESALVRFDLETGDAERFDEESIYAMEETPAGDLWFAGAWRAIRFDPITGDWQQFDFETGPIPAWLVTDVKAGPDRVWLGTYGGGVAAYDGSSWQTWATDEEIGGNWVEAIREDQSGALWFAHDGAGLSRYQPQTDQWHTFRESDGALDWPSAPGIDSQGNVWIGDYGELVYYDGQDWRTMTAPELEDLSIYAIEIGPGDIKWLITEGGLLKHDPAVGSWTLFTAADHPLLEDIWSFAVAADGTVWIGGAEGVARYDGRAWGLPAASGRAPQWVDDMAVAPDGTLWLAADGELFRLSAGQWSSETWPSDGWLETLDLAPDGSVWVGYEGLGRYEPALDTWQMFTTDAGLGHNTVHAIHVTGGGEVWVGTLAGVSRFVPTR
jgi:ligand-binding sensor domain-containing protein